MGTYIILRREKAIWLSVCGWLLIQPCWVFFHAPQAPPFPETIYVIPHLFFSNAFQMVSFVQNGFAVVSQVFPRGFLGFFRLLPLYLKPLYPIV